MARPTLDEVRGVQDFTSLFRWNLIFASFPNAVATAGTMFFVVFGLLRLARFAGKDFRMKSFLGLPTPASAMLVIVLCLLWGNEGLNSFSMSYEPYFIIMAIIVLAFLMVSDVRYPKIRGKLSIAAGLSIAIVIFPLLGYMIVPDFDVPTVDLLFVFLVLIMVYVLGGPIYERNMKKARNNK